jgi:hypothetical protein
LLRLFTIELNTEGLKIKFFNTGIVLLKGSLFRGFNVHSKLGITNLRGPMILFFIEGICYCRGLLSYN